MDSRSYQGFDVGGDSLEASINSRLKDGIALEGLAKSTGFSLSFIAFQYTK